MLKSIFAAIIFGVVVTVATVFWTAFSSFTVTKLLAVLSLILVGLGLTFALEKGRINAAAMVCIVSAAFASLLCVS